ncbi:MAG: HEPN domain-containing protein [Lachnospiraceae bacterium]|nr:HEPN domain-containing protein [Lachnospiraceae bacterium]
MSSMNFVKILSQGENNMLDTIFKAREEELAQMDENGIRIINKEDAESKYKTFENVINSLPIEHENSKKEILNQFEKYCDSIDTINAYFNKRYLYLGFMCNQVIEKIFKAYFVKLTQETPPYTHKIVKLAERTELYKYLKEEQKDFLDFVEILNNET